MDNIPFVRFTPLPLDLLNNPNCDPNFIEQFIARRLEAFDRLYKAACQHHRSGYSVEGGFPHELH